MHLRTLVSDDSPVNTTQRCGFLVVSKIEAKENKQTTFLGVSSNQQCEFCNHIFLRKPKLRENNCFLPLVCFV